MAEILAFQSEGEDAPTNEMWKVPPGRPKNADVRDREHLTPDEVASLMDAAGKVGRHRHRDKTLILTMYRHGLRVSELIDLKWESINFKQATIHVTRKKNETPATHPIEGDELRALRKLKRDYPQSRFVLQTERGGPLTRFTVNKLIARAGQKAGIPFPVGSGCVASDHVQRSKSRFRSSMSSRTDAILSISTSTSEGKGGAAFAARACSCLQ